MSIVGTYDSTVYSNPVTKYCVVRVRTADRGIPEGARDRRRYSDHLIRFTAVGYDLPCTDAVELEFDGEWTDGKYGLQLQVIQWQTVVPRTEEGVKGYLGSGLIKGIGEKTAAEIVARFGVNALDILEKQPERLLEVRGITENKLEDIKTSYAESRALRDIMTLLAPFKLTPAAAQRIYQQLGPASVKILKENPYELCRISGFGFLRVDAIVQHTDKRLNTPMRIPEDACTRLDGEWTICLDDYFTDADGDRLTYSITDAQEGTAVRLEESLLTISPQNTGTHTVTIQISDGESAVQYVHHIKVIPLWQEYWWVLVLSTIFVMLILWKLLHKPKPELERLTEEKKQNRFCGKLDAYFIQQPEGEDEIPPLSFQMNKVKDGRVSLGALFGLYPEQAKALQLEDIFLIADENHNMILYHRSKAGVMVGNTIACMQIQYSISFGDIIYITSPDGNYDLEIHYVAVFQ